MNIVKKLWLGFCWVMIGFFLLGVLGAFIMPFTEPDVSFVDAIITFTFSALFAWIFFIPIKKSKQRKKAEIVEMRERLNAEKKEAAELLKETELIQEMLSMIKHNHTYIDLQEKMKSFLKMSKHLKNSNELNEIEKFIASGESEARKKHEKKLLAELEAQAKKEAAELEAQAKKEAAEREALEIELQALCNDESEWKSFKKKKICIGMHIKLVGNLKGYKWDEKRNISADQEIYKYKYGKFTTPRGSVRYKLEVTYEDDRVTSFKDL